MSERTSNFLFLAGVFIAWFGLWVSDGPVYWAMLATYLPAFGLGVLANRSLVEGV